MWNPNFPAIIPSPNDLVPKFINLNDQTPVTDLFFFGQGNNYSYTTSSGVPSGCSIYLKYRNQSKKDRPEPEIEVIPNPSSNRIKVTNCDAGDVISLYNSIGEKILVRRVFSNESEFDISNLPNGIYLIFTENKSSKLFIKQ